MQPVKVLKTSPIDTAALLTVNQLEKARVQYRHFDSPEHGKELYTGIVTEAKKTRFGISVLITPDKVDGMSLQPKWRNLRNDVTGYAWFETPVVVETAAALTEKVA